MSDARGPEQYSSTRVPGYVDDHCEPVTGTLKQFLLKFNSNSSLHIPSQQYRQVSVRNRVTKWPVCSALASLIMNTSPRTIISTGGCGKQEKERVIVWGVRASERQKGRQIDGQTDTETRDRQSPGNSLLAIAHTHLSILLLAGDVQARVRIEFE